MRKVNNEYVRKEKREKENAYNRTINEIEWEQDKEEGDILYDKKI